MKHANVVCNYTDEEWDPFEGQPIHWTPPRKR